MVKFLKFEQLALLSWDEPPSHTNGKCSQRRRFLLSESGRMDTEQVKIIAGSQKWEVKFSWKLKIGYIVAWGHAKGKFYSCQKHILREDLGVLRRHKDLLCVDSPFKKVGGNTLEYFYDLGPKGWWLGTGQLQGTYLRCRDMGIVAGGREQLEKELLHKLLHESQY